MTHSFCKQWIFILMVVCFGLLPGVSAEASEQARQFLSGVEAYKGGDYPTAINEFTTLAQSGVVNGRLYYNLGNAHLKNGELGQAILWYERALKMMPDDPDLLFNLKYARSLTKDVPEESISPLVRIFFFWNYQFSQHTIKGAAIACNLLFWLLIGAWRMIHRRGLFRAAVITAVPAVVLLLTTSYNYYHNAQQQQAVILPKQTAIRSGLEETSTQLFVLHAGAKVDVIKQLKDFYQIRYSADKIGWVRQEAVGVI